MGTVDIDAAWDQDLASFAETLRKAPTAQVEALWQSVVRVSMAMGDEIRKPHVIEFMQVVHGEHQKRRGENDAS